MNREDYLHKLQSILDLGNDCKAQVYFAMNCDDGCILKKANIQHESLQPIADAYKYTIRNEIMKFEEDAEYDVLNLSDRDDRSNVVYRYDIPDEEPSFFNKMREVVDEHPQDYFTENRMFNFNNDSLSKIDYFVIEVGSEDNKIVIYRNNFNVNLMKQARGRIYFNKSGTQLATLSDDILRMDSQIDVLKIDDDFFILNIDNLDKSNDFASIITSRAHIALTDIERLNLVDGIEDLRGRLSELAFARRLMRSMDSSPVTDLPAESVINFVSNHDKLKKVLKVVNGRIKLSSKKSQDYFLRLLNDDFLHSQLTENDYTSTSKNELKK